MTMPGYFSRNKVQLFNSYAETVQGLGPPTPKIDEAVWRGRDINRDVANLREAIGFESSRALATVVLPPAPTFRERRVAFLQAEDRKKLDRIARYLLKKGCRGVKVTSPTELEFEAPSYFFLFEPGVRSARLVKMPPK